jgi:hypothetical protein
MEMGLEMEGLGKKVLVQPCYIYLCTNALFCTP